MDSLKNHAVDWQEREERYIPYAGNWLAAGNWKSKYPGRDKSLRLVVGRPLSRQETRRQITKSVLDVRNTDWCFFLLGKYVRFIWTHPDIYFFCHW
jgi:hypothetical protein